MKKFTLFLLMGALLLGTAFADTGKTDKKIFYMTDEPADMPFSPAILVGNTLYLSGHIATDPETGKFIGGDIAAQTERVIKNLKILLKKAGMDLSNVVKATVYITDFDEFGKFNEVFKIMFPQNPPTRATVQVVELARGAKIEISAVAVK